MHFLKFYGYPKWKKRYHHNSSLVSTTKGLDFRPISCPSSHKSIYLVIWGPLPRDAPGAKSYNMTRVGHS